MTKHSIDVDDEVFALLQESARPFIDSPNDVLRRLLLTERRTRASPAVPEPVSSPSSMACVSLSQPELFVQQVLTSSFGQGFKRVPPYRMLFESRDAVIYVQNFSKKATHLWYRIAKKQWDYLCSTPKTAGICLTNPVEKYFYALSVADIQARARTVGWDRDYLEVNIDPGTSYWTELKWNLTPFRKVVRS